MDKKGQSEFALARKEIYWMIAGVVITVAVLGFAIIMSGYQNKLVQVPPQFRAEVISLRFLNTPECFTYEDPVTNKTFPGVIDLNKYTQERLDGCYKTEKEKGFRDFNFGLRLEGYDVIKEGEEQMLMTNNFFNKVDFTLYRNVLVRSNGELTPSRMVIHVQKKI